jgi:hypothetical protein
LFHCCPVNDFLKKVRGSQKTTPFCVDIRVTTLQ